METDVFINLHKTDLFIAYSYKQGEDNILKRAFDSQSKGSGADPPMPSVYLGVRQPPTATPPTSTCSKTTTQRHKFTAKSLRIHGGVLFNLTTNHLIPPPTPQETRTHARTHTQKIPRTARRTMGPLTCWQSKVNTGVDPEGQVSTLRGVDTLSATAGRAASTQRP